MANVNKMRSRAGHTTLIIIPAFNEQACIANVVREALDHQLGDVLVIDDCSVDYTALVAEQAGALVLQLPYNLGIGGAVQAGFKFAAEMGYSYVLRIDGDGQHSIAEAARLLESIRRDQADVAIGSRFIPGQQSYHPPWARALGIRWFATVVSTITRQSVTDPTSGMQALNRRALTTFASHYPQDYPEVEARIWLHKLRLRVIELPVYMAPRAGGMSSITYIRAIYYMVKVTLAVVMATLGRAPRLYARES